MSGSPLVSVVTPVFNGAKYLSECIESVLAQSYGDLEHVILDNASSDATREIAQHYANLDRRIRLFRNETTVPVIENWNRALERISPDSRYCQTLHGDDWLYPRCLAAFVALGERHPEVGIIGSLRRRGDAVQCEGLPKERSVFEGREIVRLFMREEIFALAPTSGMVRSDIIFDRRPFYPPGYLHADLAAYFDILDSTDFGFVHEVLAFSRTHADSITSTLAERKRTLLREGLMLLQKFGPRYFRADQLATLERKYLRRYYRILLREMTFGAERQFRDYHMAGLREADRLPTALDLIVACMSEIGAAAARPHAAIRSIRARLHGAPLRQRPESSSETSSSGS